MSVDYSTILGIGKWFKDSGEAEEYFRRKIELTEAQEDELDEVGFTEFLQSVDENLPYGEVIDHYSGYGFWIGYQLNTSDGIQELKLSIEYGESQWRKIFGEEPEIIDEVSVY